MGSGSDKKKLIDLKRKKARVIDLKSWVECGTICFFFLSSFSNFLSMEWMNSKKDVEAKQKKSKHLKRRFEGPCQ